MAMDIKNPLTEEHCAGLDEAIRMGEDGLELLARCKRAGIDVSEYEAKIRNQVQQAKNLKSVFFPGRTPPPKDA